MYTITCVQFFPDQTQNASTRMHDIVINNILCDSDYFKY